MTNFDYEKLEIFFISCACVPEALTVECVEQGVSGPVGDAAAPVRLAALSVLVRLPAEGALQEGSLGLMDSTYLLRKIIQ